MNQTHLITAVKLLSGILLYVSVFVAVFYLFRALPGRTRRLIFNRIYRELMRPRPSDRVLRLLVVSPDSSRIAETGQQLLGAGIKMNVLWYAVWKRFAFGLFAIAAVWGWSAFSRPWLLFYMNPVYVLCGAVCGVLVLQGDRIILDAVKKQRAGRMVKEIYLLCNQLLYYADSKMNLHRKLELCLPFTRTIRPEVRLLLNEWYQDAGQAIQQFKHRLGTEDGYSFAETLNSLRLFENEAYYDLLRNRIQDYKDKLELIRDGKKETTSYLLFVLAGIPILNTFRLFIYPWVQEGQKLFQSLN
jgi:hypothetical protein